MSTFKKKEDKFLYGFCEVSVHQAENLPDEDATLGVSCVEKNKSDPAVRIAIDNVSLGNTRENSISIYKADFQITNWITYSWEVMEIHLKGIRPNTRLHVAKCFPPEEERRDGRRSEGTDWAHPKMNEMKRRNSSIHPLSHSCLLSLKARPDALITRQTLLGTRNLSCFCAIWDPSFASLFMTSTIHLPMKSWAKWLSLLVGESYIPTIGCPRLSPRGSLFRRHCITFSGPEPHIWRCPVLTILLKSKETLLEKLIYWLVNYT